jgi:hypothetical protein
MRIPQALLTSLLLFAVAGCAHKPISVTTAAPTLTGDPAHPGQTHGWVDTKLYFGLEAADVQNRPERSGKGISETQWREFLDREVTPRFPSGLSVLDVYGQWQSKGATSPSRIRSKLLIIDYPNTRENRDKVEAIRAAWKQQTGQQSVLRVTEPVDVSF